MSERVLAVAVHDVEPRSFGRVREILSSAGCHPRSFAPPAAHRGWVMRIDVHPADFDLPGRVATLASLLRRSGGREAVTYDELVR